MASAQLRVSFFAAVSAAVVLPLAGAERVPSAPALSTAATVHSYSVPAASPLSTKEVAVTSAVFVRVLLR